MVKQIESKKEREKERQKDREKEREKILSVNFVATELVF